MLSRIGPALSLQEQTIIFCFSLIKFYTDLIACNHSSCLHVIFYQCINVKEHCVVGLFLFLQELPTKKTCLCSVKYILFKHKFIVLLYHSPRPNDWKYIVLTVCLCQSANFNIPWNVWSIQSAMFIFGAHYP